MYTGDQGVTLLDFDGTLKVQDLRLSVPYEWIDCSDVPGTRGLCDPFAAREIRRRLASRRHHGVTLIGSGNYHYVSYFLLSEIREPFALVLFDHHTDLAPAAPAGIGGTTRTNAPGGSDGEHSTSSSPTLRTPSQLAAQTLTCGSWVSWALAKLTALRRVVIVGARTGNVGRIADGRVTVIDEGTIQQVRHPRAIAREIDRALGAWPVYVSVDKDVLRRADAATDWDAGSLRLGSLLYWLVWLRRSRRIVGVDICGEWPASPLDLLSSDVIAQVRKNQAANRAILEALRCG